MKNLFFISLLSITSLPVLSSDTILGRWTHSETYTPWMQEKPQTFVSYIEIKRKNDKYFAEVKIEGHHACSTSSYIKTKKDLIFLDTSFKENKDLGDFTNAEEDKPCKLTIKKHLDSLTITSESPGCSSECGANASFVSKEKFKK